MAKLKVRPRPKAKPPAAPKALTIEEARDAYDMGSEDRLVAELKELAAYTDRARELTNAENRQKTQAKKAFKAMIANEDLEIGDEVLIGPLAYRFDFATADSIDRRKLYDMVKSGKVEVDTFLKCVYINKDMASKLIGDHILLPITSTEQGKTADVRKRELDRPVDLPKIVKKPLPPASKKKLSRETDIAPGANVNNARPTVRRRRKVNVGK